MKIWANTLVRNEEKYLWFSVMSVINYVDRVLIWDDGSIDNSVRIARELVKRYPNKIVFKKIKKGSTPTDYPKLRQGMLEESKCDWVILVDGDEVWWDGAIFSVTELIRKKGGKYDSVVNSYKNIIGDIYHYQEESAGMYTIDGKKGHITIRAMNKHVPGLHFDRPHGQLCLLDRNAVLLQEREPGKRIDMGLGYMHFTNMPRSGSRAKDLQTPKRGFKFKYELGKSFSRDYFYPEVFFRAKPSWVESPWQTSSFSYRVKAMIQTPLKKAKRKIGRSKVGY